MKKKLAIIATLLLILCALCLSACVDPSLKEVEGTYELTDISGSVAGVTLTLDTYEYYRIILDGKGNGTVQSKFSGVGATKYEGKGTYTYSDGKIYLTSTVDSQTVTEVFYYEDGVITITVNQINMNFTAILQRVED